MLSFNAEAGAGAGLGRLGVEAGFVIILIEDVLATVGGRLTSAEGAEAASGRLGFVL